MGRNAEMNVATKAALKRISFFGGLTDSQSDQIAEQGREISVPAGEVLFQLGDAADCMYYILEGKARVYLPNDHGDEVALATLAAGDCVGEMALLDGGTRSASVAALTAGTNALTLQPMISGAAVAMASDGGKTIEGWRCGATGDGTTILQKFLPSSCRGVYP